MSSAFSYGRFFSLYFGSNYGDTITGSNRNDIIIGFKGNDILKGAGGNDWIDGGSGNDVIDGNRGNDTILGGSGNDIITDGSGNDRVDASSGDDTVAWVSTLNRGNRDTFEGGSGKDILHLELTRDDWLRADVQRDVAAFLRFLDTVTSTRSGEADCRSFTFASLGITVSEFEKLEIVVDGSDLDPKDEAVVARNDAVSVGEDAATAAGNKVIGNVLVNDSVPDLVKSVVIVPNSLVGGGTVTMAADGTFTWTAPAGTDFQAMAADETRTISFRYVVTDADGDTSQATATITVVGADDAPVIAAIASQPLTETTDATPITKSFSATFTDADLNDVGHTARIDGVTVSGATSGLTLDATQLAALVSVETVTKAAGSNTGTVQLSFSAASTVFDYLAQGETVTLTYTPSVDDHDGGIAQKTFEITVTGANDVPVINGPTVASVTEDTDVVGGKLTASGTISISDADTGESAFRTTVVAAAENLGSLTLAADGTYVYAVDNSAIQYLNAGQTKVEHFTITTLDGTIRIIDFVVYGTNDGALDIVVANVLGGAEVSLGNGDGTFQTCSEVATGGIDQQGIALGDINNDGNLDIVVADMGAQALVSLGNGDGTFQAGTPVATGGSFQLSVALGDADNDGNLDIVVADYYGGAGVSLGRGDGTFQAGTAVATGGTGHYSVALGDLNNDGELDIVVPNENGGAQVSLGNGDGTFQTSTAVATGGTGHYAIALGDVNNDGELDIVVSDDTTGARVGLGNGDGTFQAGTAVVTGGTSHLTVALGDLNDDGKLDIVVGDLIDGAEVCLGNGDGSFGSSTHIDLPGYHVFNSIALGDIDAIV